MTRTGSRYTVHRAFCVAVLLATVFAAPVWAQDNDARLKRIENEIQTLSRAVFKGEQPPPGSLVGGDGNIAANTELRLQQIETDLRTLTGTVEQRNFDAQQEQARNEQAIAALEMRISQLEMKLNGSAAASPGAAPAPNMTSNISGSLGSVLANDGAGTPPVEPPANYATPAPGTDINQEINEDAPANPQQSVMGKLGTLETPANGTAPTDSYPAAAPMEVNDPVSLYEQAFSYLRDQNYAQAETGFTDFLTKYPDHDLAANAQYWLGESYYVRNDFEKAARVFAEAYQKYPKGPKGPDNLLKLGMALTGMGKTNDACLTYAQLQKDYPNGAMPVLMRAEQEMEKLNCSQSN